MCGHFTDITGIDIDAAAQKTGQGIAAAIIGDIDHFARITIDRLKKQGCFHPVLRTNGTTGANCQAAFVFLDLVHQVIKGFVFAVCTDDDRTEISTNSSKKTNVVFSPLTVFTRRDVQKRTRRECNDGIGIISTGGVEKGDGNRTNAARHKGHLHRVTQLVTDASLGNTASQVKTATRLGRGNAFGFFNVCGMRGAKKATGHDNGSCEQLFHSCILPLDYSLRASMFDPHNCYTPRD